MFTACKKEEDEADNVDATANNIVKMKVDNDAEIVYKDNFSAGVLGDKLIIGASDNASGGDVEFFIDPDIATGTYSTGFSISHGVNGQAVFTTITNSTSSTLTITKHDTSANHIEGTFSVDFNDNNTGASRHAEGSFNVKYL